MQQQRLKLDADRQQRLASRQSQLRKNQDGAAAVKDARHEHQARIEQQRQEELLKKASVKQNIRQQQRDAEAKRRQLEAQKQAKARAELERRMLEELQLKEATETEIAQMEALEMELIQRLQNSQMLQKNAFEELEQAMHCPLDEQSRTFK